MKRTLLSLSVLLISLGAWAQTPKYVFYFIGDGMGTNQIQLTEMYRASIQGRLGIEPLCFTQFPVATIATHYSASSDVTDSAASGTALAAGVKTKNGYLGVDPDGNPVHNMAEMAKAAGKKVGIVTSTAANHATPGAFEAHQMDRGMYYEISQDMIANGFDFYGGAALYNEERTYDKQPAAPIRPQFEAAGYTICNPTEFQAGWKDMKKVLMLPGEGQYISYSIDAVNEVPEHKADHVTFKQLVESAVTFLMKDNKKGFFLMAEGSEIDHACHSHDAATCIQEVIDFDEGIQVAFEFYKKYPKQTLIVITADHETGSLTLSPHNPGDLARLQVQKHSMNVLSSMLRKQMEERQDILSWEEIKTFLGDELGLWKEVKVDWEDEKMLRDIYEGTVAKRKSGSVKDLYADNAKIVSAAVGLLNKRARVYWVGSHSSGYTPVFAIGAGADQFTHKTDNAQIARDIMRVAGYK
ncbi:MAG: alkaline phosphatase [Bacteroidales bacterium]|nr:alkaline phosphatase [Bacteroidales bacterium]